MIIPFSFNSKKQISPYMNYITQSGGANDIYSYAYLHSVPYLNLAQDNQNIYYALNYYNLDSSSFEVMYINTVAGLPVGTTTVYTMYANYDFYYGQFITGVTLINVSPNPSTRYFYKY